LPDYLQLYHLEAYLFSEVTKRFRATGTLSAFDFFCIVIWKANRSKSKVASRLKEKGHATLEASVDALLRSVSAASDPRARLKVLIVDWGFRLPMASAILTVLYPDEFTVYDVRVCDLLDKKFKDAQYKTQFEALWAQYSEYLAAVRDAVPDLPILRDKDRYLWGKSFAQQLEKDIAAWFQKPAEEEELEA